MKQKIQEKQKLLRDFAARVRLGIPVIVTAADGVKVGVADQDVAVECLDGDPSGAAPHRQPGADAFVSRASRWAANRR